MKRNILVTTLGDHWQLVPELFGFTNPEQLPLYRNHPQREYLEEQRKALGICAVDALWLILTDAAKTLENYPIILDWQKAIGWSGEMRFFILQGISDITEEAHVGQMRDLIYRVVLHAAHQAQEGRLFLSLVGGRKTMSADMQQAGHLFGCHAMLHVLDNPPVSRLDFFNNFDYRAAIPREHAEAYLPVVISGQLERNPVLGLHPAVTPQDFPLEQNEIANHINPRTDLVEAVEKRLSQARNLLYNFSIELIKAQAQTNFHALYTLSPDQIQKLQESKIGSDPAQKEQDLAWLRLLPKAELHCHFGGILTPAEMIETARANARKIAQFRKANREFDQWLRHLAAFVASENLQELHAAIPDVKAIRTQFAGIPEPLTVAAFLSLFEGKAELLERFIFGDYLKSETFSGIGIENYEILGDLQGSALMQSEESIRAACRILLQKCERHHVRYLEVRQSPVKYTRGGLSDKQVVDIIRDELMRSKTTIFKAIFIASRHGKMSEVHQHIELAQELFKQDAAYRDWIVGFDLAGAENARRPSELREAFLPLMKESMKITIHAGENEAVENIWEAVYHLNADRIGHGLTLNKDARLQGRFLDHKITIEMCPSSNAQIVGYDSKGTYPLKDYLAKGLRVTVNTDNPGISRTDFTHEYYRAAQLSPQGLSRWEILQLIRNGFRGAFLPFNERRKLLLESEKAILNILMKENS